MLQLPTYELNTRTEFHDLEVETERFRQTRSFASTKLRGVQRWLNSSNFHNQSCKTNQVSQVDEPNPQESKSEKGEPSIEYHKNHPLDLNQNITC